MRQPDNCHSRGNIRCARKSRRMILKTDAVFRVKMNAGRIGEYAETTPASSFFEHAHSVNEEPDIATEPIDQESTHQLELLRLQKLKRSCDGCKHAASVDIGDQNAWSLDPQRKVEVHEVVLFEIQLRDASSTFDNDVVIPRSETVITLHHRFTEKITLLVVLAGG